MLALSPEDAIHIENKTKCIQGKIFFIGTNTWYIQCSALVKTKGSLQISLIAKNTLHPNYNSWVLSPSCWATPSKGPVFRTFKKHANKAKDNKVDIKGSWLSLVMSHQSSYKK